MSASKKRRPFRGLFGGLLLGIGLSLMLMIAGVVALNVWYILGGGVIGLVVGIVLAYLAPARHPKTH